MVLHSSRNVYPLMEYNYHPLDLLYYVQAMGHHRNRISGYNHHQQLRLEKDFHLFLNLAYNNILQFRLKDQYMLHPH